MLLLTIMLNTINAKVLRNTFDIYTLEKLSSIHLSIRAEMLIKLISVI